MASHANRNALGVLDRQRFWITMKDFFGYWLFRLLLLIAISLVCIGPLKASPVVAAPNADGNCIPTWQRVPSPNPSVNGNFLSSTSFASASDGWAVGYYYTENAERRGLIEHWDGTEWSVVPMPALPNDIRELDAITAIAADDAWAVGSFGENTYTASKPLLLHWDGANWSYIAAPFENGWLASVSAASADDVWSLGNTQSPVTYETHPALLHWDGHTWATITPPTSSNLVRVLVKSANEVWLLSEGGLTVELWRWDGASWSLHSTFSIPGETYFYTWVTDLTVLSPNDIWVVGYRYGGHLIQFMFPRAYHWDGGQWTANFAPFGYDQYALRSVVGLSADRVIAVGSRRFVEWDGTESKVFYFPPHYLDYFNIESITALSENDLWAVGGGQDTWIMHGTLPCKLPPASPPALTSPLDGAVLSEVRPTWHIARNEDTEQYFLEIWNDPPAQYAAEYGLADDDPAEEPQFRFDSGGKALPDGAYTWRVQGCNYAGCSPWSESRAFHIQATLLSSPPTLVSPADGIVIIRSESTYYPHVSMKWIDNLAGEFTLELRRDSPEGALVKQESLTREYTDVSLEIGDYVWRVNGCNNGACGPWSPWRAFTVFPEYPGLPGLFEPTYNQLLTGHQPKFEWWWLPIAAIYQLQLNRDSQDGPIIGTVEVNNQTSWQWQQRLRRGTYFWRVSACVQQYCSPWSDYTTFTIQDPPLVPQLVSPKKGETVTASRVLLDWSDTSRAATYDIQIWRGTPKGAPLMSKTTELSELNLKLPPTAYSVYTWRVRACNQAGCSKWSPYRVFKTK